MAPSSGRLPKLFITDLDGTALGGSGQPYARFSDEWSSFLGRLTANGCRWATNTTWEVKQQLQLFYASAASSRPSFVVGGSGGQLCTIEDNELRKVEPYSGMMEQRLEEAHRQHTYPLMRDVLSRFDSGNMFFNGYWFAMTALPEQSEYLLKHVEENYLANSGLRIVLIPEEQRFYTHPAFLRKGTAAKEIARIEGLHPDEIVVAGDEIMDLDMMDPEIATHAICPDNAHPEVKQRVLEMGGVVGTGRYGSGVLEAFTKLAEIRGWNYSDS